jgi:hypothetical protein
MPELKAGEEIETLRDWFAGQALSGLPAGVNAPKKSAAESSDQYALREAEEVYLFADAMLKGATKRET